MLTHEILNKYFQQKKRHAPGFSLRAVAKRLDVSPSFLSRIFSGQRPVPYSLLLKMKSVLDIAPEVFSSLKEAHEVKIDEHAVPAKGKRTVKTALDDWELASQESVKILREWYFLPILQVASLKDFDGHAKSIAGRLGLKESVASRACDELVQLGLLNRKAGLYINANKKLRWDSAKSVEEVRKFHSSMLEQAQKALRHSEQFERRLITGVTLTTSPEKIAAAKKKLADCLHEIANDLISADESATEVFHLAAQLFPLTGPLPK
jgi:uncharacterized protein (TIGR02147 family)